jgi:hypothetical protein
VPNLHHAIPQAKDGCGDEEVSHLPVRANGAESR